MKKTYSTDYRSLVAVNELINFAERLPLEVLTHRNEAPTYPVTFSEQLVVYMLDIILTKEWQKPSDQAAAEEVESVLSQLDTGVNAPKEWEALFHANKVLGKYLSQYRL